MSEELLARIDERLKNIIEVVGKTTTTLEKIDKSLNNHSVRISKLELWVKFILVLIPTGGSTAGILKLAGLY